jgi:ATP-binding cassette subfamily F protein uup
MARAELERELEALPAELEALEAEQLALTAAMSAPDYHRRGPDVLKADRERAVAIERLLADRYARWSELEEKAAEAARAREAPKI